MIELPAAHVEHPRRDRVTIIIPERYQDAWMSLAGRPNVKKSRQLGVRLFEPTRPISKGKRGLLNRIYGHCQDVAFQLSTPDNQYTTLDVKEAMKRMSRVNGYPSVFNDIDGIETAMSLSQATMEDGNIVQQTIQDFADHHKFWLTEYDEHEIPYKSLYGKTRSEMDRDYPEVNVKESDE